MIVKLLNIAEGSPRNVCKLLDSIAGTEDEKARLACLDRSLTEKETIELCRALANPKSRWADIQPIIASLEDDPESIRRMILGYFGAIALKPEAMMIRFLAIIECFTDRNFMFDGKAGLISACFEAVSIGKK